MFSIVILTTFLRHSVMILTSPCDGKSRKNSLDLYIRIGADHFLLTAPAVDGGAAIKSIKFYRNRSSPIVKINALLMHAKMIAISLSHLSGKCSFILGGV